MRIPVVRSYIRDEVETIPSQDMKMLQVERLRASIDRLSQTVPFYQEKLREAGVTAASIHSREDLTQLPFTTKGDLRDHYPFGLAAVPMKESCCSKAMFLLCSIPGAMSSNSRRPA